MKISRRDIVTRGIPGLAASMLFGLWMVAAGTLLVQDRAKPERLARELRARREFRSRHGAPRFGPAMRAYLRRDFHPLQETSCDDLARNYAAAAGLS